MKNLTNQKGITLVALVVTIIVLLILAGVSLSLVAGSDGILGKATNAVDKHQIATIKEKIELKIAEEVENFYEAKYVNRSIDNAYNAFDYLTAVDDSSKLVERTTINEAGATYTITYTKGTGSEANKISVTYKKGKTLLAGNNGAAGDSTGKVDISGTKYLVAEELSGTISNSGSITWWTKPDSST